jgi:hypothetical protein
MAAARRRRAHTLALPRLAALFLALCLLLLLAACARTPTPPPNTGIEGQVLIGPMCPVIQAGTPCPDQPYQATLLVLDSRGNRVGEVQSDALGQFQIPLPPGDYRLVPQSPDGFTHAAEQNVSVIAGQFTLISIIYDSGIR